MKLRAYLFVSMLLVVALNSPPAQSQEVKLGDLVISQPWSRAAPRGAVRAGLGAAGIEFAEGAAPSGVVLMFGLTWLLHTLYPDKASGNLREQVRSFYKLFYQVDVNDADLDRLLDSGG